ncbi:hypothetical protein ACA910_016917 [Epithemia clementina (nom. ined.)]
MSWIEATRILSKKTSPRIFQFDKIRIGSNELTRRHLTLGSVVSRPLWSSSLAPRSLLPSQDYQYHQWRGFASSSSSPAGPRRNPFGFEEDDDDDGGSAVVDSGDGNLKDIVLFERSIPPPILERSSFPLATICSVFFLWYALDFVPAVNSSGIQELYVHPVIPGLGMGGAIIYQVGSTLFPRRLVNKLVLRQQSNNPRKNDQLLVYTHTIPFFRPSLVPIIYDIGEVGMSPSSSQTQKIIEKDDISQFKGYIPLYQKGARFQPPYLMNINDPIDVRDPFLLLEAIIHPGADAVSKAKYVPSRFVFNRSRGKKAKKNKKRR